MPGLTDDDFGQRARQLRVDTLIRLRWLRWPANPPRF